MIPYRCPNCGKVLELPDGTQSGFCVQCGTAFTLSAPEPIPAPVLPESESTDPLLRRAVLFLEEKNWALAHQYSEKVLDREPENAQAYLCELLASCQLSSLEQLFSGYTAQYAEPVYETLYACDEAVSHIGSVVADSEVPGYLNAERIASVYSFDRSYASALSCRKQQRSAQQAQLAEVRTLNRALQFATGELKEKLDGRMKALNDTLDERVKAAEAEDEANVMRIRKAYSEHLASGDQTAAKMKRAAEEERDNYYRYCADQVNAARTESDYCNALNSLNLLGDYKNTPELRLKCGSEISRLHEAQAIADKEIHDQRMKVLKKKLIIIGSAILLCAVLVLLSIKLFIPMLRYHHAISLREEGKYGKAISIFEDLEDFRDSEAQALECVRRKADSMMEEGKYDEAYDLLREYDDLQYIILSLCSRAADQFEAGDYGVASNLIDRAGRSDLAKEVQYEFVDTLIENGRYQAAYLILKELPYDECPGKRAALLCQHPEVAEIGDTVRFGSCEQDGNTSNGKEAIEWIVIDKKDGKVLLLSKYVLDCMPYSRSNKFTWSESDLLEHLNGNFLPNAFTDEEQAHILTSTLAADKNPKHNTPAGKSTEDKIFILSLSEMETYFPEPSDRVCAPTKQAKSHGAKTNVSSCTYWLRTPGAEVSGRTGVCYINFNGAFNYAGFSPDTAEIGYRPAMWIGTEE